MTGEQKASYEENVGWQGLATWDDGQRVLRVLDSFTVAVLMFLLLCKDVVKLLNSREVPILLIQIFFSKG